MLSNMWNYIKNFLRRSKEVGVGKKTIVYTVEATIEYGDEGDWRMKAREVRSTIKKVINQNKTMKITKIDSRVV